MPQPQAGILPEPNAHARFLIVRVREPRRSTPSVARVLASAPALAAKVGGLDRRAKLVCTVSLGPEFWESVSPHQRPHGLRPFTAMRGEGRTAPYTGGDLLFHIVSKRPDLNFELALRIMRQLGDTAAVMDDVAGFRYLDSRDLTGFIDGTANPKGKARAAVALIGAEDREFANGSYVFTQRYVHDLTKWAAITLPEQEGAIGRRRRDSKELSDQAKPPTAHISRVVMEESGKELEIVRHSFPYGTVSEAGLFFIAYTRNLTIPEKMLSRMMGTTSDGLHDHLMDFTQAVSGATFFAPSLQVLRALPGR